LSRLPVRIRVTLIFTVVMAVVLGATGLFVYDRLRADLDDAIGNDLQTRAGALATAIRVNDAGLGESARSLLRDSREGFAQVLTAGGALFDARVQRAAPVLTGAETRRALQEALTLDTEIPGQGQGSSRLLATPIGFEGQRLVTVVATPLAERDHALESLRELLLIGGPIALALAALAAYATVAAALRPVEAMRIRAAEISDAQGGPRLPVPPARDELQRLGETLNAMLDRIDSARQRERAFVDDASHELRAPLATHRAELELALRYGDSPEELRAAIASGIEDIDRLASLAEDLLELARADKGALEVRREAVDVAGLLAKVRGRVPRYGRPPLRLWAQTANGRTELHVSDSGPGFPPEFLPHAFERFRRADAARSDGGTGLGLAIVDAIATAHGGRARAANALEGGADVWIELPA
jgi:two-component system OmpR family sensor kinase